MRKLLFWTTSAAAVALVAVTGTQLLGQADRDEQHRQEGHQHTMPADLPGPIVNTHELMDLFNKPLYQFLRKEMQKDLGEETEWDTIADRGLQAAEVMNLVAIRERKEGQEQAWRRMVRGTQEAALGLSEAAKQHDAEHTRKAYQSLLQNCNACHQTVAPNQAPQLQP